MVNKILNCRSCQSRSLEKILDLKNLPLAGSFSEKKNSGKLFPLSLLKCDSCGLIQTGESIPKSDIFREYSYESGTSSFLVNHLESLGEFINIFPKKNKILEIGCNDGTLINKLKNNGHFCLGVDPSNISKKYSKKNKWELINNFFSFELTKDIIKNYGKFDIVVSTNSFAHNDEIEDITKGIWEVLRDNGHLIIEVQNGIDTLRKNQFDTIYHEHTCYFTPTSIHNLLSKNKFKIISINNIDIHNGSIRIVAKKLQPSSLKPFKEYKKDYEINSLIKNFQESISINKIKLGELLKSELKKGKKIIAYGASGRSSILLNYYGLDKNQISYIVDNSKIKINKYIPNTDIKINDKSFLLDNPPDIILITAWNYQKEIIEESRKDYKFKGKFIVPLPSLQII